MNLFFLMILQGSLANSKPPCSIAGITNNCKYFKDKSATEKIILSDGTSFHNPMYDPKAISNQETSPALTNSYKSSPYSMGPTPGDFDSSNYGGGLTQSADPMALWRQQSDLLDVLDIPQIPTATKLYLSANIAQILASPDEQYQLPAPINKEEARQPTTLSGHAIMNSLTGILGKVGMTALRGRAQPQVKAIAKQIQAAKDWHDQQVARDEQVQRNIEEIQKASESKQRVQYARANRLFDYTKKEVVSLVTGGKPESQWSETEKTMVAKIKPISLLLAKYDINNQSSLGCTESPANSSPNLVVQLCPELLDIPSPALIWDFAHEIAHYIDPCNLSQPLWDFSQSKLDGFVEKNKDTAFLLKMFKMRHTSIGSSLNFDIGLLGLDPQLLNQLIENRVFVLKKRGIPFEEYPYQKEYNCLVNELKFANIEASDIEATEQFLKHRLENFDLPSSEIARLVANYRNAMVKYPQCFSSLSHKSQMGEVMSDALASVVRENYLLRNPPTSEEEKMGAILSGLTLSSTDCDAQASIKKVGASPLEVSSFIQTLSGPHPPTPLRIDKIGLNLPGMAEMYGCERKVKSCFDNLSRYKAAEGSPSRKPQPLPSAETEKVNR